MACKIQRLLTLSSILDPHTTKKERQKRKIVCVRVTGITPIFKGGGKCAKCSNIFGTKCPSIPHTAETIHANSGDFAVCIQGVRDGEGGGEGENRRAKRNRNRLRKRLQKKL